MSTNNNNDFRYKIGDTLESTGVIIDAIVGLTDKYVVYICNHDEIGYEIYSKKYKDLSKNQQTNLSEICKLVYLTKNGIDDNQKNSLLKQLGHLILRVLESPDENLIKKIEFVEMTIKNKIAKKNYRSYL